MIINAFFFGAIDPPKEIEESPGEVGIEIDWERPSKKKKDLFEMKESFKLSSSSF